MDSNTFLTATGIVLSVFLGTLGIYYAIRRKYSGAITYSQEYSIALYNSISKYIPDLQIIYKDKPAGKHLVLLRGILINTGGLDISNEMVDKPISAILPEGSEWLEATITSTSNDVIAEVNLKDNTLNISINSLFRCGEVIEFQALAESSDKQPNISFHHRIANTQKIRKKEFRKLQNRKEVAKYLLTAPTFIAAIGIIFLVLIYIPKNSQIIFPYDAGNESIIPVTTKINNQDKVQLEGFNNNFSAEIEPSDFLESMKGDVYVSKAPLSSNSRWASYVIAVLTIIGILISLVFTWKNYGIWKNIKISVEDNT